MKTQRDYIQEIAEKINKGVKKIENPTLKDIEELKEFESIITRGKYTEIIIRKKMEIELVLNIPVPMFNGTYEIGDEFMGIIPCEFTAEQVYGEMLVLKGVIDNNI